MALIKKLQQSFSAKLSFYVLLFTICIFLGTFFFFYFFASRTIEQFASNRAMNLLDITKYKIENVFTSIKAVHTNIAWAVIDKGIDPDSLYQLTRDVLVHNPNIFGCAVAFEPHYFSSKGYYFSPFSSRQDGYIETIQLGNDEYDYFSMEWYQTPKKLNAPHWTEPYYDEGGGQMLMFTYSTPLHDKEGNFIGILTADVSLNWLTDMVNEIRPYKSSYCVMLGRDGTYIVHPSKDLIMKESIFTMADRLGDSEMEELGTRMINGEIGVAELANTAYETKVDSYIFFTHLLSNNWSLGMVIHKADVFEELIRTRTTVVIFLVVGLILLFVFCMITVKKLTQPLRDFSVSAREIAHGNFNASLPEIHSKDEMKELQSSFEFMQKELTNYISELQQTTSERERINSELRIASAIQMGMIPKVFPPFPDRNDVDLYAMLRPAKEVGGDLYDFFIDDEKLYFTIGDVSGKGIPASLFMAVTRSLFRSIATHLDDPDQIVSSLNTTVADNNDSNMFVTLFVGILDLKSGLLRYVNAGHNPPVLITPEGAVNYLEVKPNIPVGLFDSFCFQSEEVRLLPGSMLFLYTDGLTESENISKELYSDKRLLDELGRVNNKEPRLQVEAIVASVEAHAGEAEQSDDLTLLAIHYNTK